MSTWKAEAKMERQSQRGFRESETRDVLEGLLFDRKIWRQIC